MKHEKIAEDLTFPLWRCIDAEFKSKYRSDAWGIFENFLKSAAFCEDLKSFLDKFKRLAPIVWQHQFEKQILSVIQSEMDEEILLSLRTECAYIILLTRALNEERKEQFRNEDNNS